uniref:Uncharacterized protein n=1 Tax=Amphilophus citrinellus TaxID=61819 RepID=A0A3Q0SM86_AMPCI
VSDLFINNSSQTRVPLLPSRSDGDLPFTRRLLETGCDPNICNNCDCTGLHLAAFLADPNTALHLRGHVDAIQFLVSSRLKMYYRASPVILRKIDSVTLLSLHLVVLCDSGCMFEVVLNLICGSPKQFLCICFRVMESCSLINPNLQSSEDEFVEDCGFMWVLLLLIDVFALFLLCTACYSFCFCLSH